MIKPKYFILDVDGVMTTGQFFYSKDGKIYKVFGPHDSDGLKILWRDKWIHIRKSNTEPIIRIISEALNSYTAKELINSVKNIVS